MSSLSSNKKQRRVSLLDKYEIIRLISTDGDGEVFEEIEKKTGDGVVVKKYADERELKEIDYLSKLNCPFVLTFLDDSGEHFWIVHVSENADNNHAPWWPN